MPTCPVDCNDISAHSIQFFPALTVALKPLSFFYLPSRDNFMLHTSVAGLQIMLPLPMWLLLLLLLLHTNAVDPTIT
ncbi:hypothetical protein BX661DRAFT_18538 [Kickxella alabastrina]|uniref:uncharacterized protein n=1 Tax=Kickxella alabastrina TaxID=61397 RepID=UPI00221FF25B|nr:uncharacterized protein BX661DRAFT_18538 [Kickxella alabastrina]KAI7827886.1 hypothetical protein BX661DRAFT_18538 [Kickxella alabastrina]